MQPILTTLAMPPFAMEVTAEDHRIFNEIYQGYRHHNCSDDHSLLFANISFLLAKKSVLDHLLSHLEADVKAIWEDEKHKPDTTLSLHQPSEFIDLFGLRWPVPSSELASNHSHYLLSRVLLQQEQAHHLNLDDGSGAPVPTFTGFINKEVAINIINNHQIWNEESKISGLFYHGKMTHRIHLYLVMKAMDLNLLDTGGLNIHDLLQIFTKVYTYYTTTLAWRLLFDNVLTEYNKTDLPHEFSDPIFAALSAQYPVNINEANTSQPYLYTCDPYFFHSYLMTHARELTPHLSECITQTFSKAALAIQRLERKEGKLYYYGESTDLTPALFKDRITVDLKPKQLKMKSVLKRQATFFANVDWHRVSAKDILADREEKGKNRRLNTQKSRAGLQYRILFNKPDEHSRKNGTNAGPPKRTKN